MIIGKIKNNWHRDFLLLFLLIGTFFLIGLGARPYITPSEARYIEIPRQILSTGDWLTPHINGVQYFEKPPLFYWIQAFFLSFGDGEIWGRIATMLVVTLTCLVTYATGRLLYGRAAGFFAALSLSTSVLGYGLAHIAMLDAPVTLFLTCSIASFIFAQKTGEKKFYYFMYAAAAAAMMTKGLIGIVIPALVIGSWIIFSNNWKILKQAQLFTGALLFFAIAAPWHILMAIKHPEFLDFYFIHEHFTRFISNEHKRTAPWWFFIAVTAAGIIPWLGVILAIPARTLAIPARTLVIPAKAGIQNARTSLNTNPCRNDKLFLTLWIILPLAFFSSSHSKLVPYIFPIFPPLFIMIGKILAEWWKLPIAPKLLRANAFFMVFIVLLGIIITQFFDQKLNLPQLSKYSLFPLLYVAINLLIAALAKMPSNNLISWLLCLGVVLGLTASYIASDFDKKTIKPLAKILKPQLKPDDLVVAYNSYWHDIPVYLNRNITISGWTGELDFGIKHTPNAKDWIIDLESFWKKCAEAKANVYVFMYKEVFSSSIIPKDCQLRELSSYGRTMLLKKEVK